MTRGQDRGRARRTRVKTRRGNGRAGKTRAPSPPTPTITEQLSPEIDLTPEPFELEDRWGEWHVYHTDYFGAGFGFDTALEILSLTEGALAKLEGVDDLGELSKIEIFGLIAGGLSDVAREILKAGGHKFACELLERTRRDGVALYQPGRDGGFQRAYQGNQLELMQALYHVITINWGDFFEAGSSLSGLKPADEPSPGEEEEEPDELFENDEPE